MEKEWEFIASIPKDAKPCFNDKTLVNTNEWFVTLKRRYKGEKAEWGVIYVNNLIENLQNSNVQIDKNLLKKAVIGLNNLVYTYTKDGQNQVAEDYKKCIEKLEKNIKKDSFFVYNARRK